MTQLGYTLSSEEFGASSLVAQAERAERAGFAFASISDHFHPWVDEQGEDTYLLFPTPTGKLWRERNFYRDVWVPAQRATAWIPRMSSVTPSHASARGGNR